MSSRPDTSYVLNAVILKKANLFPKMLNYKNLFLALLGTKSGTGF